jgi:ribosome-binding protein aMBF1 (putative translation factor)
MWRVAKTIRSKGQVALCQALVEARIKAGLGQEELAAKLMCHQSLVARIESGQRRIDVVELVVLARAMGFDPSEMLALVQAATEPDHRI